MNTENLKLALKDHAAREVTSSQLARARRDFLYFGYAKMPFLVPDVAKQAVADEVIGLVESEGIRRDLRFAATGNTARRMRNVRRAEIAENGSVISALYESEEIKSLLSAVAGESVLRCPYEPEQYVITRLEQNGDTHGWHWDDYSFALVWVVECPPVAGGGFVQCVPGTRWDKERPQLHEAFVNNPIYSIELAPGDLYLMRTDTTLHRVYPIQNGRRTIINMGYASEADLSKQFSHETMDALWQPVGAEAGR